MISCTEISCRESVPASLPPTFWWMRRDRVSGPRRLIPPSISHHFGDPQEESQPPAIARNARQACPQRATRGQVCAHQVRPIPVPGAGAPGVRRIQHVSHPLTHDVANRDGPLLAEGTTARWSTTWPQPRELPRPGSQDIRAFRLTYYVLTAVTSHRQQCCKSIQQIHSHVSVSPNILPEEKS